MQIYAPPLFLRYRELIKITSQQTFQKTSGHSNMTKVAQNDPAHKAAAYTARAAADFSRVTNTANIGKKNSQHLMHSMKLIPQNWDETIPPSLTFTDDVMESHVRVPRIALDQS